MYCPQSESSEFDIIIPADTYDAQYINIPTIIATRNIFYILISSLMNFFKLSNVARNDIHLTFFNDTAVSYDSKNGFQTKFTQFLENIPAHNTSKSSYSIYSTSPRKYPTPLNTHHHFFLSINFFNHPGLSVVIESTPKPRSHFTSFSLFTVHA